MTKYRNIQTSNPDVSVHITYTKRDHKTTLRGYAIRTSDGCRLDGAKTLVRTASSKEAIPSAEQHLIAAVTAALSPREQTQQKAVSRTTDKLQPENEMVKTFEELKQSHYEFPAWNSKTTRRRMLYFERNILPHLQKYVDEEFLQSDLDELKMAIIERIQASGKSKQVINAIETTATTNLTTSDVIYAAMCDLNPDLPHISLAVPRTSKKIMLEQVKALPEGVRRKFYAAVESAVETDPTAAFAAVLMTDGGLRTSEAAGVLPQILILQDDGYVTVPVLCQEDHGGLTPELKTTDAYRLIPLSWWGSTLIRRCVDRIGAIPDGQAIITARELSAWVLQQLRQCGCDEKFIQSAQYAQGRELEFEQGRVVHDIAAYVLRRDRTDRWRNCCGLSCDPNNDSEIDYLLGHKTPNKRRSIDLRVDEYRVALQTKLERYIYNGKISKNPAVTPIPVTQGDDIDLIPFPCIRIRNTGDEPLSIHLDVEAMEAGEAITLQHPQGAAMPKSTVRQINTGGVRQPRPIIGEADIKT